MAEAWLVDELVLDVLVELLERLELEIAVDWLVEEVVLGALWELLELGLGAGWLVTEVVGDSESRFIIIWSVGSHMTVIAGTWTGVGAVRDSVESPTGESFEISMKTFVTIPEMSDPQQQSFDVKVKSL